MVVLITETENAVKDRGHKVINSFKHSILACDFKNIIKTKQKI